ncbi:hypothetical protein GCM10027020_32790 [Nocardioides salsibiostraticola]
MSHRYSFDFDAAYRVAALPFGVTPRTAYVEVDGDVLRVRFGLWRLETTRDNIEEANLSGDYAFVKTAGPAHLSFSDNGVTFATNGRVGICLKLRQPVKGIDPTGRILHPGVTLTVKDTDGLLAWARG